MRAVSVARPHASRGVEWVDLPLLLLLLPPAAASLPPPLLPCCTLSVWLRLALHASECTSLDVPS